MINTAASGSLMMDCLPSDDEGRPLSASRDLAFHEWASRIPETGLPLVMGASFLWFPSHTAAFQTFFCVGGVFSFITNYIFIVHVHPKDELLDKSFQCTRHWYYGPKGHYAGTPCLCTRTVSSANDRRAACRLR